MDNDFFTVNNDWNGNSYINNVREIVSYHNGTTMRIWCNRENADYKMHWHPAMEIILPVENHYDAVINTTHYHILPGDILIVPPRELHELQAPENGTRFIYLFDISPIASLKGFAGIQSLLALPLHISHTTPPSFYEEVYQLLLQMRDEYFNQNRYSELTIYSLLLNFLVKIGDQYAHPPVLQQNIQPGKQHEYVEKFNNLLEYIDSHYMEDLTLESMADATGFSKFHFSRLFKQYTKFTFCDYLRFRRIKVSETLLEQPDLSITEVALQSGFPSISTFNRLFKEQKKCTPSEYRMLKSTSRQQ